MDPAVFAAGIRRVDFFIKSSNHIYEQLSRRPFDEFAHRQAQLFLDNCLSILPFSDITPYESFKIPQFIDNHWVMVDYYVRPIELTPTTGIESFFIQDHDRLFAYGLEPLSHTNAESHLIFMATTYPVGQGFFPQLLSIFSPLYTKGESLYQMGLSQIEQWAYEQRQQSKKYRIHGMSLGGVMGQIRTIHAQEEVSELIALNPPGLYEYPWKGAFDYWDNQKNMPKVIIQKYENDPFSCTGVWKKEWTILNVSPPEAYKAGDPGLAHSLNYLGYNGTQCIAIDTEADNIQQRARYTTGFILSRAIPYYLFLLPYHYTLRPAYYFIVNRPLESSLSLLLLATAYIIPLMSPFCFTIAAAIWTTSLLLSLGQILQNKFDPATCHSPELPRNESLDTYKNKIRTSFDLQEIKEYYRIKRCVLKEKSFLPTPERNNTHVQFFMSDRECSKIDILSDTENSNKSVIVHATPAKIHDMKRTLRLFSENMNNTHEIQQQDRSYQQGKRLEVTH